MKLISIVDLNTDKSIGIVFSDSEIVDYGKAGIPAGVYELLVIDFSLDDKDIPDSDRQWISKAPKNMLIPREQLPEEWKTIGEWEVLVKREL